MTPKNFKKSKKGRLKMDFLHLVESGKYDPEELSTENKEVLRGYDNAVEEMETAITNIIEKEFIEDDDIKGKLIAQIQEDLGEKLKEWMKHKRAEHIVVMLDYQTAEAMSND